MKQITQIGANIEEALHLALQKLGVTRDQVDVEVLQKGKKGFLGFGVKPAEIRVTIREEEKKKSVTEAIPEEENVIESIDLLEEAVEVEPKESIIDNQTHEPEVQDEDPIEKVKQYIVNIAKEMGIHDLNIEAEFEGKRLLLNLGSEKAALLIGKHGATLNALQQLSQLVINNSAKSYISLTLDVENYRERREATLEQLANRMADKAVRSGRKVALEPMPSHERKIIHNALADRIDIETYSEGTEPNRYLVIESLK